jgi:hypothetical protein
LLLAALVISCGGGGDGGDAPRSPSAAGDGTGATPGGAGDDSNGGNDSNGATYALAGARIEESHAAVTFDSRWTNADRRFGWSGGAAMQSSVAGARASFTFMGTSVRWLGSRGDTMGRALVRVDAGPAREVDLWALPNEVIHTPIVTISDLSDGPHTLTSGGLTSGPSSILPFIPLPLALRVAAAGNGRGAAFLPRNLITNISRLEGR